MISASSPGRFPAWFARFLPGAARGEPASLFTPATVSVRNDPQLVHLDGLNLSRAWCLQGIAAARPAEGLAHVASGDYAGEHWLASFAVYLLSTGGG